MIFLIDAHLPRRLARILQQYGHDAYHTLDLPHQNRTDDDEIMQFADMHDCIVTTKDSDFVDAFYLQHRPQKLWLLSTGNISNRDLEALIRANIDQVVALFQLYRFVELSRTDVVVNM
jgi:predicted nuclease of predicted toxin-antitoxin system